MNYARPGSLLDAFTRLYCDTDKPAAARWVWEVLYTKYSHERIQRHFWRITQVLQAAIGEK